MRKIFILPLVLLFASCGHFSMIDTGAQSGVADKATGDSLTAAEFTAVKNTADTADAQATTNDGRLDDIEGRISSEMDPVGSPNDMPTSDAVLGYGDANWADIVTGTDPDQSAGQLGQDTDGANLSGDETVRATDSSGNQWPVGQKIVTLSIPFSTSGVVTGWQLPTNESGMTFTITRWFVRSDTDDLVVAMAEYDGIDVSTVLNELGSITASSNATGGTHFYGSQLAASMTQTAVETTHGLDFDISAAAEGWILIQGWFDANVD